MPTKRRPTSLLASPSRHDRNPPPVPTFPTPPYLETSRIRTQSLRSRSGMGDEVYIFSNSSNATISLPVTAPLHNKMTRVLKDEVPSYISSRSANSLISFSRPTRIQAVTLYYLNKILDELLLHILTSAKSLATDRIKTDGILKVLGGQTGSGSGAGAVLAKNAVLEAELELRNYLDGQRKEGGKVPLGLSATSRWDGTATFPVQKAYEALRIRCQFYSTLGDLEDPSPHSPQDQNIMSADGRPIATITPGVAIYVTALLEFVAEYILQNVGRVIERDNSDEAGIGELKKAMEEDEGTMYWWNKMATREELVAREKEEQNKGAKGRVGKPWKVPEASEWDEAAGRKKFQRQSIITTASHSNSPHLARLGMASPDSRRAPSAMSSNGYESRDSSILASQRIASPLHTPSAYHTDMTSISSSASTDTHHLVRKASTDKGWFGKKRGSVRASSDMGASTSSQGIPFKGTVTASDNQEAEDMNSSDDFDSLMMSNQTMKVSLTPNRLRSIEVKKEAAVEEDDVDGKRNNRRRPGTLSPLLYREGDHSSKAASPSPSPTVISRFSNQQDFDMVETPSSLPPRSMSRQGSSSGARAGKKGAPPPSAYRAVSHGEPAVLDEDAELEEDSTTRRKGSTRLGGSSSTGDPKLRPRTEAREEGKPETNVKEMVDMFNSTPPLTNGSFAFNSGRDSRMSQSAMSVASTENGSISRKSALTSAGGKMRNLFGKRTPSSSTSIVPTRSNSEDSMAKLRSPSRQVETSSYEQPQLRRGGDTTKPMSNTAGLAITGAAGGVVLDALTRGLLEGHDRAVRSSLGPKPVEKEPQRADEEAQSSRDISVDPSLETADVQNPSNDVHNRGGNGLAGETASSGLVGVYQNARASSSASELSLNTQQIGRAVPNRKVPWTYSRQSSAGTRRLSGTPGSMGAGKVGSGASSSLDHGSTGENAPPSAWSNVQTHSVDVLNGVEGRTTTPSLVAAGSPRSPTPSNNRPSDTARTLAQLNHKMKGASSVEECRFLLTQALAIAAAAVRNDVDQPSSTSMMRASSALSTTTPNHARDNDSSFGDVEGDIPDEEGSSIDRNAPESTNKAAPPLPLKDLKRPNGGKAVVAPPVQVIESVREELSAPVKHRNLMLPMAVGYNTNEDLEAPSYKQLSYFVAWLLEGEQVGPEVTRLSRIDSASPDPPQRPSSDERSSFQSANELEASPRPVIDALPALKKSDSITSVYRDASSDIGVGK